MPKGIWLVRYAYPDPDLIIGCFTDEAECAKWLKSTTDPRRYRIERYNDGLPGMPERIRINDLLEMETP